jgi:hypothetical protein
MKFLYQTKFGSPDGNCFPTCLACLLDYENPEDFLQFQKWYDAPGVHWMAELQKYLIKKHGVMIYVLVKPYDGMLYLRGVKTENGTEHETIWKDGKIYHDPNPKKVGTWSDGSVHPIDQQFLAFADCHTFYQAFDRLFATNEEFDQFWYHDQTAGPFIFPQDRIDQIAEEARQASAEFESKYEGEK